MLELSQDEKDFIVEQMIVVLDSNVYARKPLLNGITEQNYMKSKRDMFAEDFPNYEICISIIEAMRS